jgi:hypothetical protein
MQDLHPLSARRNFEIGCHWNFFLSLRKSKLKRSEDPAMVFSTEMEGKKWTEINLVGKC